MGEERLPSLAPDSREQKRMSAYQRTAYSLQENKYCNVRKDTHYSDDIAKGSECDEYRQSLACLFTEDLVEKERRHSHPGVEDLLFRCSAVVQL